MARQQQVRIELRVELKGTRLKTFLRPPMRFINEKCDWRELGSAIMLVRDLLCELSRAALGRKFDREVVTGRVAGWLPENIDSLLVVESVHSRHVPEQIILQQPMMPRAGPRVVLVVEDVSR